MSLNASTNLLSDAAPIAANRSGQAAHGAAYASLLETLAKANDFTLEDLQANRQGWMSPLQRAGAIRRTIGWFFLLLILAGAALLFLIPLTNARRQLRDGRVAIMDGVVGRETKRESNSDGGYSTSYSSVINQQRLSVTGAAYYALVPGRRYRVYYLPLLNKLVSIEPLP